MCFVKCMLPSGASHVTNLWESISSGVNFQGTFFLMMFGTIAINVPVQGLMLDCFSSVSWWQKTVGAAAVISRPS